MRTRTWVLVCALAVSANVHAAGIWGAWSAGGTSCSSWNVHTIENGSTLAVLFDEFNVYMPEGTLGDGMSARKTCTFRIQLTPPKGFYLARFRQVYSGGVIKSANSSAQLNIRYNVGPVVGQPLPIVWRNGVRIRPEDHASLFNATYDSNLAIASCGGSTVYGINMSITATRRDTWSEHLIAGLESVDADLQQKLVLIPEWALCRR